MSKLRHSWEQVMFNLIVQKRHPPVNEFERSSTDIHGMDGSVANPVNIYIVFRDLMSYLHLCKQVGKHDTIYIQSKCIQQHTTGRWVWDTAKLTNM